MTRDKDSDAPVPVIEASPTQATPLLLSPELVQRVRQQEILAELGVNALKGASFDDLLTRTVLLVSEGLGVQFCKVLEYRPKDHNMLVRAGIGWGPDVVGIATVGADLESPAGFALHTGKPVISNHLEDEERFRTPSLLKQHGVRRAMNVILQADRQPYGVLEVDSQAPGQFCEQDIAFLQGAANILGMSIESERRERRLKEALERQQAMLGEMSHRVKNSLAIVASFLRLQAREVGNPDLTEQLQKAGARVSAVARAHDRLYQDTNVEQLDLGIYLSQVCRDLDQSVSGTSIQVEAEQGISVATDRAISAALIVAELVTNAAKYAYQGQEDGRIWVRVARHATGDHVLVSVRDEGVGLPEGVDPQTPKGLGMQIISAFSKQLGATVTAHRPNKGTEFRVSIPLQIPSTA